MAEISTLPIWKKDASAYERLSELALLAKEHPSKFSKFVLVYQEQKPNGNILIKEMSFKDGGEALSLFEEMGLLEAGKFRLWDRSLA